MSSNISTAFQAIRHGQRQRMSPSCTIRHSLRQDQNAYHAYEVFAGGKNGRTMLRVKTLESVSKAPISPHVLHKLIAFTAMSPESRRSLNVKQLKPNRFELTFTFCHDGESYQFATPPGAPLELWTADAVHETLTKWEAREEEVRQQFAELAASLEGLSEHFASS